MNLATPLTSGNAQAFRFPCLRKRGNIFSSIHLYCVCVSVCLFAPCKVTESGLELLIWTQESKLDSQIRVQTLKIDSWTATPTLPNRMLTLLEMHWSVVHRVNLSYFQSSPVYFAYLVHKNNEFYHILGGWGSLNP